MKTIVLLALALAGAWAAHAQTRVSGTLTDASDRSCLLGVNVTLSADSVLVAGDVTDAHGRFSLSVPVGEYVLSCSSIGYESVSMLLRVVADTRLGEIPMSPAAAELGEVVVEGRALIRKVDRQLLLPTREQTAAAHDGVSLLQNLQLPRIVVNPVSNAVKTLSDEAVQLRINGVEATADEVRAVNPKDVIRIEYHDQPGVRYNGAAAVIDYIVRRRETGGNVILAATDGITLLGTGSYYAAGKLAFGKSSLQAVVAYTPSDYMQTRTDTAAYRFTTGIVRISEVGTPARYTTRPLHLTLNYNWTNGDKNMLHIRLRDNMTFTPASDSDRDARLYLPADSFSVSDREQSRTLSPSLDIYYQHNLPRNQHIFMDIVGTYIGTFTRRLFLQTPLAGSASTDTTAILSAVRGAKWSLIAEAIYEKGWESVMLTVGARHNTQWVRNTYSGSTDASVGMTTAETYLFAEMRHRLDRFSYVLGLGAMHTFIRQGAQTQSAWIARPQLTMSYDFGKGVFWKYKGYVSGYQPSLADLSDVSQRIDAYQLRRGNPSLRPVMYVSNHMELSWQHRYVNLALWADYTYDHRPIMDETHEETLASLPVLVRTYANQRGFHRLQISPSLRLKLLDNKLVFNIIPFFNYYASLGNCYTHTHFNPGLRAGVFYLFRGWRFYADVVTSQHNLWGETLTRSDISHDLGINYNTQQWGCGLMLVNPFLPRGCTSVSQDLSALSPSVSERTLPDHRQLLMLNFNLNLDFGTRSAFTRNSLSDRPKRINNEDTDTGILK